MSLAITPAKAGVRGERRSCGPEFPLVPRGVGEIFGWNCGAVLVSRPRLKIVLPGLGPGIHEKRLVLDRVLVDGRAKPGHERIRKIAPVERHATMAASSLDRP